MPWRLSCSLKYSTPKSRAFCASTAICSALSGSGLGSERSRGRHVVIDDGERLFRRAHLAARQAQAFERLRRRHFMHEMPVDIEQAGAVLLLVDQMIVPDLVVEGTRFHGCLDSSNSEKGGARSSRERACRPRRSKTGENRCRHLAKEPPRQARMVLQHDGVIRVWPIWNSSKPYNNCALKAQ